MKVDWSQNLEHLKAAEAAFGFEFKGSPVYWLAVVDDAGEAGAVALYHNFTACGCELSVLMLKRFILTREHLAAVFGYPFLQLNLRRLTSVVRTDNARSIEQTRRLGFTVEGIVRHWYEDCDGILSGMTKEDCKWV